MWRPSGLQEQRGSIDVVFHLLLNVMCLWRYCTKSGLSYYFASDSVTTCNSATTIIFYEHCISTMHRVFTAILFQFSIESQLFHMELLCLSVVMFCF